ncbi:hypothetical protein C8J56DRAFT_29627 [Mycena floridula]|nr:hypothetical protein C8J56DRAFT_29627 [Mycena floridula]
MFASGSPYSPFFTSGLLLATTSSSSTAMSSARKRGSLPTAMSSSGSVDRSSSFYFKPAGRNSTEFRSFLSLDLAESQSLRSFTSRRRTVDDSFTTRLQPILEVSRNSTIKSPSARSSRISLRIIPSPKPVPSTLLPEIPKKRRASHRPSISESHVPASLFTAPADRRPLIQRRATRSTTRSWATVSTGYRKTNRSDALARLEGRVKAQVVDDNFMSMTDDDGDGDNEFEEESDADSLDLPPFADRRVTVTRAFAATSESDSDVLPSPINSVQRLPSAKSRRSSSWMPLKSFIDLHEHEDSQWGYRSFIQISVS